MNPANRSFYSFGTIALASLLFIALLIISNAMLRGWRVDLTENGQYTLSVGTREILENLQEPVTLYLFFSEESSRELPQLRSYAAWVEELVEEMAQASAGGLSVRRINPLPFSPDEDRAAEFGLQSVPVGAGGDMLYFGLAGTNSLDDVQVMPFIQPSKERFLEYDLAKMVATLSRPERRKVALFSSLELEPGFDPMSQGLREGWVIYDQLTQLFDVETLGPNAEVIAEDVDLLFMVHPRELSAEFRYELDQFVLRGGRLVVFLDPMAEMDTGGDPSDPMARMNARSASDLGELLTAWGVAYDAGRVVGDLYYALQVSAGAGMAPVRHLGILSVTGDGLNSDDIVSADLEAVNFSSAGWFEPVEDATTAFEPLVLSSENAAPIDSGRLRFLNNPNELLDGFEPTGDRYALAARVTGPAQSLYEQAPTQEQAETHRSRAVEGGINVLLFADSDVLSDRLWVQKQNFLGQTLVNSFADNGSLVVNGVDHMLGSPELISIRTRATSARPFTRVDRLRLEAEEQFRATEERLQRELEDTERKLTEIQSSREDGDLTVLSLAQETEIQRFVDQRLKIRADLREVRHQLDREIDGLGTWLKIVNIGLVPILVIVLSVFIGQFRQRRRKEEPA